MRTHGLSLALLMEESEARIGELARNATAPYAHIAIRVLEDLHLYHRWEAEHEQLMRSIAAQGRLDRQAQLLRTACFGFIHRKALFDYLRTSHITGRDRHAVFELIHGGQDYVRAVLTEHCNYVRSTLSFVCSQHIGIAVLGDGAAHGEPMHRYELRHEDFFRAFCSCALASNRYNTDDTLSTLVPYLKRQLGVLRRAILAMPCEPPPGGFDILASRAPAANASRVAPGFQAA